MAVTKKRVIKSLENLSEDLRDLMREQYPNGYEASISRIMNAKKEPIFVFPLETEDAVFLVKVPATKNSDGGYDVESGKKQEFEGDDDDLKPVAGDDDFEAAGDADDFDAEGDGDGTKEASYDPDFDN
jgi:hypothetical protein